MEAVVDERLLDRICLASMPMPFRMITSFWSTALTGIPQDRTTLPALIAMQDPPCAIPQPTLGHRKLGSNEQKRCLRIEVILCSRPFTLRVIRFIQLRLNGSRP